MNLRPMTAEERKYSYDQSTQLTGQTGCIGCLSGTLDAAENVDAVIANMKSLGFNMISSPAFDAMLNLE